MILTSEVVFRSLPVQAKNKKTEVIINNICNQIYFNNKVIEFLKNNDLFNKFFNTENEETYKEVITNLYNLQIMYNHLKEVHNNGFLIDKIF